MLWPWNNIYNHLKSLVIDILKIFAVCVIQNLKKNDNYIVVITVFEIDKKCFGLIYTHQIGFHVNLRRIWPLSHDKCERLLVKGPVWNLTVVIFGKNVLQKTQPIIVRYQYLTFFSSRQQLFFKTTSKSQKYGECMRNWNINMYFSVSSTIYYLWCNIQKHNPVDVYSKQNALWIWFHRSLLDKKIKAKDINLPQ